MTSLIGAQIKCLTYLCSATADIFMEQVLYYLMFYIIFFVVSVHKLKFLAIHDR